MQQLIEDHVEVLISNELAMILDDRSQRAYRIELSIPTAVSNHNQSPLELCPWIHHFRQALLIHIHNILLSHRLLDWGLVHCFELGVAACDAAFATTQFWQFVDDGLLFFLIAVAVVCLLSGFSLPEVNVDL